MRYAPLCLVHHTEVKLKMSTFFRLNTNLIADGFGFLSLSLVPSSLALLVALRIYWKLYAPSFEYLSSRLRRRQWILIG